MKKIETYGRVRDGNDRQKDTDRPEEIDRKSKTTRKKQRVSERDSRTDFHVWNVQISQTRRDAISFTYNNR